MVGSICHPKGHLHVTAMERCLSVSVLFLRLFYFNCQIGKAVVAETLTQSDHTVNEEQSTVVLYILLYM